MAVEISAMAQTHLKPRLIFGRCVGFLVQNRIQAPTSRNLTDSIRTGLHERKAELVNLMDDHLGNETNIRRQIIGLVP